MKKMIFGILLGALFIQSCDKGLTPPENRITISTGISGTVFFQNWPAPDSLLDLRLVAFKNFPPDDIFVELLSGQAFAYPAIDDTFSLPLNVDQLDFQFEFPAGDYGYLAVAQQFGPNVLADWRAVGQFDLTPDSLPTPLTISEGQVVKNIFIAVDFNHLPIQPF